MKLLIDTDILIDVEKGLRKLPEGELYISVITLYEFIRGRKDYKEAKKLLSEIFTVLPLSNKVIVKSTEIWRDLKRKGEPIDDRDILIGATAIAYGLPLLTKNISHFTRLTKYGLKLLTSEK